MSQPVLGFSSISGGGIISAPNSLDVVADSDPKVTNKLQHRSTWPILSPGPHKVKSRELPQVDEAHESQAVESPGVEEKESPGTNLPDEKGQTAPVPLNDDGGTSRNKDDDNSSLGSFGDFLRNVMSESSTSSETESSNDTDVSESIVVPDWFAENAIQTREKLRASTIDIGRYGVSSLTAKASSQEYYQKSNYAIHTDIFRYLRDVVSASLQSREEVDSQVLLWCPTNFGHYFLDCVVSLLAMELQCDVIHLDSQVLADLAVEMISSHGSTRDILENLPYSSYTGESVDGFQNGDNIEKLTKSRQQGTLRTICRAICHYQENMRSPSRNNQSIPAPISEVPAVAATQPTQNAGAGSSEEPRPSEDMNIPKIPKESESEQRTHTSGSTGEEEDNSSSTATDSVAPTPVIIHVRDFQELSSRKEGQEVLQCLLVEGVMELRKRRSPAILVGSYCTSLKAPPMYLACSKAQQAIPVTPPGWSRQRAVFTNDRFRWNASVNIRNLKHSLRERAKQQPIGALADIMADWDLKPFPELKASLERQLWPRTRIYDTARVVYGSKFVSGAQCSDSSVNLCVKDVAEKVLLMDSCNEHNIGPSRVTENPAGEAEGRGDQEYPLIIAQTLDGYSPEDRSLLQPIADGMKSTGRFTVRFDDVIAPPRIKDATFQLLNLCIKSPSDYTYGVLKRNRIPGVMLYGPPGTGKTLMSKAIATEAACATIEVSGAQIMQSYVGQSEKIIEFVFAVAHRFPSCVVLIDEADSILGRRKDDTRTWEKSMVNQFLHEWDKLVSSSESTFVIVSTNRPQDMDEAVLRRLPRRLHFKLPGHNEREAILQHYLHDEQCHRVDIGSIVKRTRLYSGSDLKNVCVQAALCATEEMMKRASITEPTAPKPRRILTMEHFERALEDIRPCISPVMLRDLARFEQMYGSDMLNNSGTGIQRMLSNAHFHFMRIVGKLK